MKKIGFTAAEKRGMCKKAVLVLLIFSLLSYFAAVRDRDRAPETNGEGESVLKRKGCGEGKSTVEMEAEIQGERRKVTVTVGERQYSDGDLAEVFQRAVPELEKAILGKNKSLDEVRGDLNLITKIPGSGVLVSWRLKDYKLMDISGKLNEENLKEEGSIAELHAILSANGREASHTFYVRVFPPERTLAEDRLMQLKKEIKRRDKETRESAFLALPGEIDGAAVRWYYPNGFVPAGLMLLGAVAAAGIWAREREKKKKEAKERQDQMSADYSQILIKLTLFLKAGMTMHAAWVRIAAGYEEKKSITGRRYAYDEIVCSVNEMRQGVSEGECYLRFADRCGIACYRRLGSILSQNLRKGAEGVSQLLKKEAADAFEERKNRAVRAGEEAGTKLLGPMFAMLAVVIVIIVVPAFLTIQI